MIRLATTLLLGRTVAELMIRDLKHNGIGNGIDFVDFIETLNIFVFHARVHGIQKQWDQGAPMQWVHHDNKTQYTL